MTLRQPPANVAVQIVLWKSDDYLNPSVVNAPGLGLWIDPRSYWSTLWWKQAAFGFQTRQIWWGRRYCSRHYDPDKLDVVPIVLIARMEWEPMLADAVEKEIGDIFPFRSPANESYQFYTPSYNPDPYGLGRYDTERSEHLNYTRLLNWYLVNQKELALGVTDLVLTPLITLLYLSIFRIRSFCESFREEYSEQLGLADGTCPEAEREEITSDLPRNRVRLRAMVEDSEYGFNHL